MWQCAHVSRATSLIKVMELVNLASLLPSQNCGGGGGRKVGLYAVVVAAAAVFPNSSRSAVRFSRVLQYSKGVKRPTKYYTIAIVGALENVYCSDPST